MGQLILLNFIGPLSVPPDSHLNVSAAVHVFLERGQLMPRLMPNLDITVIPITVTAITMALVMDMDMLSPDIATLMSIVGLERGQLRLMPNPDIMVIPMDFTVILITDTVLMDPVLLDTLLVPLTFIEAPKVSASKNAISGIP